VIGKRLIVRISRTLLFVAFFVWELIVANAQVAYEVVTPRHMLHPGIVRVPVSARSDLELTLLSNLISLTPGTLTLEIDSRGGALFIHGMFVDPIDEFRARVQRLDRRFLQVVRSP
jgi:multicomponent Na+:H+ antiporter subunit E